MKEMEIKSMRGGVYVPKDFKDYLNVFCKEVNNRARHNEFSNPTDFWEFIRSQKIIYNYMIEDQQQREKRERTTKIPIED
jgi:hypothetical protein